MMNPDDMPANRKPEPDKHTPGLRIVEAHRKVSGSFARQVAVISQLVREVLNEVPDADFIEVRAIKLDYSPTEEKK